MKTISDFNFKNKTVLLRTDLNSDVVNKKLLKSERIKQASITIQELKEKKAKIIILAHQGKPGKQDFLSLKQHAEQLSKYTKVKFVNNILGKKAESEIKKLKSGQALLLENIRFEKHEFSPEKKNNQIIKKLVPLVDIYVNDSFSVCHRKHTSIISFPNFLPHCMGRLLERELKALKKIKIKNSLYILGGAKPEENMFLLKNNKVLSCGIFGQMCSIAKNNKLGKNNDKVNKTFVKNYKNIIKKLKSKIKNITTPEDFAVEINKKRKEFPLNEFPTNYIIYDIGKNTINKYVKEIKKSKSIFMKGPAGFCGKKPFCKGTREILKAISKNNGFSLIGGGHLNDAINKFHLNKNKFSYISLSGGALTRYISGEKLPGLEALK